MRLPAMVLAALLAAPASAHDGVDHATGRESAEHPAATASMPGFLTDTIGGPFHLVDQRGRVRTEADPDGRYQLLFFGYASCKAICSVALPAMTAAVDVLDERGVAVTPLLVTVDPERDTVARLREAVPEIHERLVGLTGSPLALADAYRAFQIDKKLLFEHPTEGPVYAHGSFIYLLDPAGLVETVIPPILSPERMAAVVEGYVRPAAY